VLGNPYTGKEGLLRGPSGWSTVRAWWEWSSAPWWSLPSSTGWPYGGM